MKRRAFLKNVGLFVCGVTSLGVCSENVFSTKVTGDLFGTKVISNILKQSMLLHRDVIEPVEVDGIKYYITIINPKLKYALEVLSARVKYKHERWAERYNK